MKEYKKAKTMNRNKKNRGFSLFELLIVMAIAAILATIGVPAMSDFVRNSRVNTARMQISGDLNFARNEAIKRNTRVLICAGTLAGCAANGNWGATGWLVCYDTNKDGICDVDATGSNPNPILVRGALDVQISLTGPVAPVVYNPIGTQGVIGAAPVTFSLVGTWPNSKPTQSFTISPTGNVATY